MTSALPTAQQLTDGVHSALYTPASGVPEVDALLVGSKWGGALGTAATLSYAFPASPAQFDASDAYGAYGAGSDAGAAIASADFRGFNALEQAAARQALQAWASVARLDLTEVRADGGKGSLRFAFTGEPALSASTYAYSDFPMNTPSAGDTFLNANFVFPDGWTPGSQNFLTLLHELGHALGLKHPHDTGMTGELPLWPATPTTLPTATGHALRDYSTADTVMAYNDVPGVEGINADFAPTTPMRLDIAALQYVYGANLSHHAGDTAYRFSTAQPVYQTIWDGGGSDTLEVEGDGRSVIHLAPGSWSEIGLALTYSRRDSELNTTQNLAQYTRAQTLYIYDTVWIENATGGQGDDVITGNALANRLRGGAGDDQLDGEAGIDTAVYAGPAADAVWTRRPEGGWGIHSAAEGRDTLERIERLAFADRSVALDLDGAAGTVAKLAGALLGPTWIHNPQVMGAGLALLDGGMTPLALAEQVIASDLFVGLAGSAAGDDFVRFVYQNVTGQMPTDAQTQAYLGLLDNGGFSRAGLGWLAGETEQNLAHIHFTGLMQTGIDYL
jgi:hypothetical protein